MPKELKALYAKWHNQDYEQNWPLYSIENGVDSFEFRLNVKVAVYSGGIVYVIRKVDTAFIGNKVHYGALQLDSSHHYTLMVQKMTPKCGWKNFMDSLRFFNIYEEPSQTEIKGFQDDVTDGTSILIEYATNKIYRKIVYHEPEYFNDSIDKHLWKFMLMWNRNIPDPDISYMESYRMRKENEKNKNQQL